MIRRFLEFAIDKPLLNHILMIFIIMLAIFSYTNIPKEIFPPLVKDEIIVTGGYVGTSADTLDKMVVQTIEDDLQNIEELELIESTIRNGSFSMKIDLKTGSNKVEVLNDVKDVIATVKKDLPADMNEPVAKIKTQMFPLVLIALAGDVEKRELLERAEELKRDLSKFKDLSDITIRGDADEELVIRLDEQKLLAYGLSPSAAITALQNISSIFPVGTIKQRGEHLYLSTYNGEKDLEALRNTILSISGVRVVMQDIAEVSFELSDESELSHFNGLRNISINVSKSENGDSIGLVKEIRSLLKVYEKRYSHLEYEIYTDTSVWIKNRLNTVFSNILFGLMLVFMAMLLFVNRGIAFVVAIGIPVSFMIGLIASEILGHSLNMLSLLGALIALGMLVDEAIVVAENIYRHLENGMQRREAAIVGAVEMFPAVLTATLTTVFAFLPMLLLSGDMGTFIKIIPIMITVLLLSSLFEAFYFLPLHAHEFLRISKEETYTKKIWTRLYSWHSRALHFLFRRKYLSLAVMVVTILATTFILVKQTKFQMFPDFDTTQIYVTGKVNVNNELEDTEKLVTTIEKILLKNLDDEDVSSVTSVIGFKMDAKNEAEIGENLFHIFIELHEKAPENVFDTYVSPLLSIEYNKDVLIRQRVAKSIAQDIQKDLDPLYEMQDKHGKVYEELVVTVPGTGVVAHDIEISLGGKAEAEVLEALEGLQAEITAINGVYNITNDADIGEMELKLRVNQYGQELGLNEALLSNELRAYYLKGEYGKMFNDEGLVRIKIESGINEDVNSLNRIEVQVPATQHYVALREVADFEFIQGYVALNKENGERLRSVFGSIDKDIITSAEVMAKLDKTLKAYEEKGFIVNIKGEEKENQKNMKEMMQAMLIALFLIFITLVWLFDSIKKPLIVISIIPLVLLGVLAGHFIMGINLTMPGVIGIVGLAGVVVNDGLIMVSFIKDARDTEELMQKALTRLRPILLTSITTVLGLMTLIFFASGQAMILQPMAISLGFGIAWATVLNLLFIPLLYSVVYHIKEAKNQKNIS